MNSQVFSRHNRRDIVCKFSVNIPDTTGSGSASEFSVAGTTTTTGRDSLKSLLIYQARVTTGRVGPVNSHLIKTGTTGRVTQFSTSAGTPLHLAHLSKQTKK